MITEINKKPKPKFPKLMIEKYCENGNIVLFSEARIGTIIRPDKFHPAGQYYINWNMKMFKDFDEIITLKNDK
jgi:hypothetical protein